MLLIPSQKLAFIHTPRAGGQFMKMCLIKQYPDAQLLVDEDILHAPAHLVRDRWPDFKFFTTTREEEPWRRSIHRFFGSREPYDEWLQKEGNALDCYGA